MAELSPFTCVDGFAITHRGFEGAAEAFKAGAVLIASANQLDEGGANPTTIAGIAVSPASGTTGDPIEYVPALPGKVFEGSLDDSNDLGAGAIVATDLLKEYGITKDTVTGVWYVDKFKTAGDARVRIIGFRDAVGTVRGRVQFVFSNDQVIFNAS